MRAEKPVKDTPVHGNFSAIEPVPTWVKPPYPKGSDPGFSFQGGSDPGSKPPRLKPGSEPSFRARPGPTHRHPTTTPLSGTIVHTSTTTAGHSSSPPNSGKMRDTRIDRSTTPIGLIEDLRALDKSATVFALSVAYSGRLTQVQSDNLSAPRANDMPACPL